jgi:hypothetical protein
VIPAYNQDGRQARNRKKGDEKVYSMYVGKNNTNIFNNNIT